MTTVIGLAGGIGSGKSTVSRILRERGADVLDADALAHEALADPEVRSAVVGRFGPAILDDSGHVVRRRLGAIVFAEGASADLRFLESCIHPWVRRRIVQGLEESKARGVEWVVLDIPLLFGSPHLEQCDAVVFIRTPHDVRVRNVQARGWDVAELDRREARQPHLESKLSNADFVIENDGTLADLERRTREVLERISRRDPGEKHG